MRTVPCNIKKRTIMILLLIIIRGQRIYMHFDARVILLNLVHAAWKSPVFSYFFTI